MKIIIKYVLLHIICYILYVTYYMIMLQICLMSRDEQSVLVVSYAELRQCLETSFGELVQSTKDAV